MPRAGFASTLAVAAAILTLPSLTWAAPAAPLPSFEPARTAPYFESGPAAAAMARFRVEDWPAAARGFDAYLAAHPKAPDREQARFLAAWALSKGGHFLDAATRFTALESDYRLLADHHRVHASRAFAAARKWTESDEAAGRVDPSSALDGEARLLRAQAARELGRPGESRDLLRGYLIAYPRSWREAEVRFRLAEAIEAASQGASATVIRAAWNEARELYRHVYIHFPTESQATQAATRLKAADPGALVLSPVEHMERGLALFEAMRNPESEAELRLALSAAGAGTLDGARRCSAAYHLAQSVFKARDRPRAAPLFDDAAAACEKAGLDLDAVDFHMKSLYQGARCWAARGDTARAIDGFARAEIAHPTHSYADDARLRQAEIEDGLAQAEAKAPPRASPGPDAGTDAHDGGAAAEAATHAARVRELLSTLADRYPDGDNRAEALFRLAFRAWRRHRDPAASAAEKAAALEEARSWLDGALARVPREDGFWEAGRTLYWSARVAAAGKRDAAARELYARCAREYPLSYYALQALNRLREWWPVEAKALLSELGKPAPTPAEREWRFAPRELFGAPAFLRGVELARLGLGAEARRELQSAGIPIAAKGTRIQNGDEELLWLAAVLYDRAGEYALAHAVPRYVLPAYARTWPSGDNRRRWQLSYPRGYAELIVDNASRSGQPAALEFAIVREESAFDPLTESFANAVGLTQLTQAPAKRFANGLAYSREALRDPAINVAIGARELGFLWKRYDKAAPLTIAAYNAGEGAVGKWLRGARDGTTMDEFIESIPYDETRGYTKRVLASWFAYHYLYRGANEDPLPPLPLALPARK